MPRRSRAHSGVLTLALWTVFSFAIAVLPAHAATGFKAQSYAGFNAEASGGAITGQKPESKLWYHDGSWWAAMLSPAQNGAHTIWKLVGTTWVDTGTLVDGRAATKEDVLWTGSKLYILSRSGLTSSPNRVRRYSYNGSIFTLDTGFPVDVPGAGMETAVLAREPGGKLWITYTSNSKPFVVHTNGSDTSWGSPFTPDVGSTATSLGSDDISSVIAFADDAGDAIGVMWSNQVQQKDYFAVHRNADGDAIWTVETALSGSREADDHINLKTVEGRVYAAVKTSQNRSLNPLIRLLLRSSSGTWSAHPVATVKEGNTRPIAMLQLDPTNRRIYVFMSQGEGTSARAILYKSSPMDGGVGFGSTTTFIKGDNNEVINNATSMKANADAASGIVVMASDGVNYWWNQLGGSGSANTPPTAVAGSATTNQNTPTTVTLTGNDAESCEQTFSIVAQPQHGTLGSIQNQSCIPGSPNTDTATVQYTPAANYSGPDSFTFRVNDGIVDSSPATETLTVDAVNTPPAANNGSANTIQETPVTVTMSGGDAQTCDLSFTVVTQPAHGALSGQSGQACAGTGPFTDTEQILYTPASGYTGPDAFTFHVNDGTLDSSDATVSLTVAAPNAAPVANTASATLNEDTQTTVDLSGSDAETCQLTFTIVTFPAHGSLGNVQNLACTNGSPNTDSATVSYTPTSNYNGPDSFTYRVSDGTQNSASATVTITVNPINDVPTATAGSATTSQGDAVNINLSGSDLETCDLTFSIVAGPSHGTVGSPQDQACASGSPNTDAATVQYAPATNYSGPDSFTYRVNDGTANSSAATVNITVNPSVTAITFRAASQGANNGSATSLVIPAVTGVQAGDVMIACVAARGNPNITAPTGWNLIRLDINGFTLRQALYWKVATASEPSSYTWTLSNAQAASGGIIAYAGVSTSNPVDQSSGLISSTTAATGTAPSITTTVNGAMVIAFFGAARNSPINPPSGMAERFDAVSNAGTYPQATEGSDLLQTTAGATGDKTATWTGTSHWIGQQLALRPSGA